MCAADPVAAVSLSSVSWIRLAILCVWMCVSAHVQRGKSEPHPTTGKRKKPWPAQNWLYICNTKITVKKQNKLFVTLRGERKWRQFFLSLLLQCDTNASSNHGANQIYLHLVIYMNWKHTKHTVFVCFFYFYPLWHPMGWLCFLVACLLQVCGWWSWPNYRYSTPEKSSPSI